MAQQLRALGALTECIRPRQGQGQPRLHLKERNTPHTNQNSCSCPALGEGALWVQVPTIYWILGLPRHQNETWCQTNQNLKIISLSLSQDKSLPSLRETLRQSTGTDTAHLQWRSEPNSAWRTRACGANELKWSESTTGPKIYQMKKSGQWKGLFEKTKTMDFWPK